MSQSSNKLVEAYVLIAIALLCMLGFSYRGAARAAVPDGADAVDGVTSVAEVNAPKRESATAFHVGADRGR